MELGEEEVGGRGGGGDFLTSLHKVEGGGWGGGIFLPAFTNQQKRKERGENCQYQAI